MERRLASIDTILELNPIPGADKIEVAKIKGWNVVVKKGDFKVDDKVVYCIVRVIEKIRNKYGLLN